MWGIGEHFQEVEVQKNKHVEYKPLAIDVLTYRSLLCEAN
jgi:hypothetical protein